MEFLMQLFTDYTIFIISTVLVGSIGALFLRKALKSNSPSKPMDLTTPTTNVNTLDQNATPQVPTNTTTTTEQEDDDDPDDLNDLSSVADGSPVMKLTQEHGARKKLMKEMSDEDKNREREAQRQQLEDIFRLMQDQQEKFGITSMDDINEQMTLYGVS